MKERGYLNYLLILILSEKHHRIRGALKGGESFGWGVGRGGGEGLMGGVMR